MIRRGVRAYRPQELGPSFMTTRLYAGHSLFPRFSAYDYATMTRLTSPASLPTVGIEHMSQYGDHIALVYGSNGLKIYNTTTFAALSNPATLPSTPQRCHYSPAGGYFAVSSFASPYVLVYDTSTTPYTKLANPGTLPGGAAFSVRFNWAGTLLAVGHSGGTVTVYNFPALTVAATLSVGGNTRHIAFSPDDTKIAVGMGGGVYTARVYSTSTWGVIGTPTAQPTGEVWGCDWSPDGSLLVFAHETSPFVSIYETSGYTKLANPGTLPTAIGRSVSFTADGAEFVVSSEGSEDMRRYRTSDFALLSSPATLPEGTCRTVLYDRVSS